MELKTLVVSYYKTNCYVLFDPDTKDGVVIDPGGDVRKILSVLEEEQLQLRAILLTHGHYDHYGAMWPLYEQKNVPVYCNEKDTDPFVSRPPRRLVPPPGTRFINGGEEIRAGSVHLQVLSCPGHTPGGMVYLCGDMLFSGDTLFRRGCGRIDLPGGDSECMLTSLEKLRQLQGDYQVYPGHGGTTTLKQECRLNPYLQPGIVFELPNDLEEDGWPVQP